MKFAEPIWLLAGLIACGALVWAWRRYDARQRAALATFASSHLHAQLTASFSAAKRHWKRGLFLAAVGCLFLALARRDFPGDENNGDPIPPQIQQPRQNQFPSVRVVLFDAGE